MSSYKEVVSFIWQSMRPQKWRFISIFTLDSLAWPIDALLWPYILNLLIETFVHFESSRIDAWEVIKWILLAGVALTVFVEISARTMGFLMAKSIPRLQANIRMTMFDN